MGQEQSNMHETLFNLKLSAKQLERQSKKSDKEEAKQKARIKKALEKGDRESARIYAENAIRKKTEGLNYLRMASRIEAVASRVQSAVAMQQVTTSMGSVVHGLDKAMQSMDLVKMQKIMDKFEQQFEDIDTQTAVLEGGMSSATTMMTPEDEVDSLIMQVADEHDLAVVGQLGEVEVGTHEPSVGELSAQEEDDLKTRLAALRS